MILPDVLAPGLDLVLCGTAPSRRSKEQGAYYAHPGNLFWRTLFETGLTPELLRPAAYRRVLAYGIGLTDLCKHARPFSAYPGSVPMGPAGSGTHPGSEAAGAPGAGSGSPAQPGAVRPDVPV